MKNKHNVPVIILTALVVCVHTVVNAQFPAISMSRDGSGKTRTFLAGQISIGGDIQITETKVLTFTPAQPLKKGDKLAAMTSDDQAWSANKKSLQIGARKVQYPILAMVKCSDGQFHMLFPGVLKAKTDIKPGEALNSDGYQIEATRPVKAGDLISVLLIDGSFLSVESSEGGNNKGETKPWFTAYKDETKVDDHVITIEAWRIEKEHVGK